MPTVVHLEEIAPGQVLSAPILNRYGQTLLAAGIVIEEKHLLMFKTWGIKHITIEGAVNETEEAVEISEGLLNLAKIHVRKRILWEAETQIETDLFNAAVERVIDIHSIGDLEKNND